MSKCESCHPEGGRSAGKGPVLVGVDAARARQIIRQGKGSMPANPGLTDIQMNDIIAYLESLK